MGAVRFHKLSKHYGETEIIRDIDFNVEDGEFMVFVGPSGCGKSTLLRMIAGLEEVSGGDLYIDGVRANDLRPAERGAAMVFQTYALYPHMTVAENMGFALKMAGVQKRQRAEEVGRAAEILRIDNLLGRYPRELSGGQRQRVAIGRAIVRKPKVFLFDEPLSNLDAALRVNMRVELARLHRELGTTMIYVTHDQVEAMTLGNRIAVFNQGRVQQLGAPLDIYHWPANEFVATFLGSPRINLIDRPAENSPPTHQALWQALANDAPPACTRAGLRPEYLEVRLAGEGIAATVALAEHLGDSTLLHLRVAGVTDLLHAKLGADAPAVSTGCEVGIHPTASKALFFGADGERIPASGESA